MNNPINDVELVTGMLQQFNPFGLKTLSGLPLTFANPTEAYKHIFNMIYENCPRGYVEPVYILKRIYPLMSTFEISTIAKNMNKIGVQDVNLVQYGTEYGRIFLQNFCKILHNLYKTKFDNTAFNTAYQLFISNLELQNLKNNGDINSKTTDDK